MRRWWVHGAEGGVVGVPDDSRRVPGEVPGSLEISDDVIVVDGFAMRYGPTVRSASDDELVLVKTPQLLRDFLDLMPGARGGQIIEIGVYRGGSTVLAALTALPRKIIAIDIIPEPPSLVRALRTLGIADTVAGHFGIDQADQGRVRQIVRDELMGSAADLAIDDASHRFDATCVTFEVVFPLLRPGGRYAIEDWRWELTFAEGIERALVTDPAHLTLQLHLAADPGHHMHYLAVGAASTLNRRAVRPAGWDEVFAASGLPDADPSYRPLADIRDVLLSVARDEPEVVAGLDGDDEMLIVERGPAALDEGWVLAR